MTNHMQTPKYKVVPLTKGYVAVIDLADWPRVRKHKWHVHFSRGKRRENRMPLPYARATVKGKKIYLHNFMTGATKPFQTDHKNHCTLDCRRSNLEVVTHVVNQQRRRNTKAHQITATVIEFSGNHNVRELPSEQAERNKNHSQGT